MDGQLSKNIIFSFFSGSATPLQKKLIEQWLQEKKNLEQYYQWLEEWETEHPQFIPDVEKGLQQYLSRIEKGEKYTLSNERVNTELSRPFHWWIAAAVAVLCLFGFLLFQDTLIYHTYETTYGEIKILQLEDGSRVTLNAHSALKVPRFGFGKTSRKVFLQGEAEFIVTHTIDNQRFLVQTSNNIEVEVLGTEFVVDARAKGTKVFLSKGKVQLNALQGDAAETKPVTMQPGDVILVDNKGKMSIQSNQPIEMHTAWKEKRFIFYDTSLREISDRIYEIYGVQVAIPDTALANRTISGNYKADNIDELLQSLSELLDMEVSKSEDLIILTDK
jgi:transmembrane sensor